MRGSTMKLYVSEHVHLVMVEGLESGKFDILGGAQSAIMESQSTNVGKNKMQVYTMDNGQAEEVAEHLGDCMINMEVNGDILAACEKTLLKIKEKIEADVKDLAAQDSAAAPEEGERFLADTPVKKVSTKKAGGHIPPEWRKLDENSVELRDHLLSHVYISDRAWVKEGEAREKGERRNDFITRAFGERTP